MSRFLLAITLLISSSLALGANDNLRGWQEVVISVNDARQWQRFWRDVNGYETVYQGEGAKATYPGESFTEILMRNPGTTSGYVRIIQFDSPGEQIRANAQSWDTGGWFDFNMRTLDIAAKARQLNAIGWSAYSNPVQFTFGPYVVKEWLARGPDGVVLALIERVQPVLEGWPNLHNVSRVFNSTQVVRDLDASRAFYETALGFDPYLEHEGVSKAEGPNVLGLPQNITTQIPRRVVIMHPQGINEGSIEILQFVGASGQDFSAVTRPPARGILSLRFPVTDMDKLRKRLGGENAPNVPELITSDLPPYGNAKVLRIYGPAGEMLEFYELAAK